MKMSENLVVCTICLATEVPITTIAGTPLLLVYERLTNKLLPSDSLDISACYMCRARLRKSHALMETAAWSARVLTDLFQTNKVTKATVAQMNNQNNLSGTLAISPTKYVDIDIDSTVPYVNETATVPATNIDRAPPLATVPDDMTAFVHAVAVKPEIVDVQSTVQSVEVELTKEWEQDVKVEVKEEPLDIDENPLLSNLTVKNGDGGSYTDDHDDVDDVDDDDDDVPLKILSELQRDMRRVEKEVEGDDSSHTTDSDTRKTPSTRKSRKYTKRQTGEGPLTCDVCQRAFRFDCDFKRHLRAHTDERPYACKNCGLRFKLKAHLKRHLLTHTGERPHTCDVCQKQFRDIDTLRRHLNHHTGERPFECDICHRKFTHSSALRRHFKIHNNRYDCTLCQYKAGRKSELAVHMRSHTGDQLFPCDACEITFTTRSGLQRHLKKRHKSVYKCDICLRMFTQLNNYEEHLKIHAGEEKPFECNICSRKFKYDKQLASHMRIHKEKRFECSICSHRFVRKLHLQDHLRVHTGERPHECKLCHRRFAQMRSLRFHMKTHIGDILPVVFKEQ